MMLLDSNICIYSFQLHPKALELICTESIALSVISAMELFEGVLEKKKQERDLVLGLFDFATILPINLQISLKSAELIHAERSKRKVRSTHDFLLAATAIVHQIPLVTANVKDFSIFPQLKLIPFRV